MTDGGAKPFLSTLRASGDRTWNEQVFVLDALSGSEASWLTTFVRESRGRRAVIVRGTVGAKERYRDLVGAALLRALRSRPCVVVSDATIEPGSRTVGSALPGPLRHLLPMASRALIRAVDGPHVTWCVLSTEELSSFPKTWGVAPERVVFTPFAHTLWGGGENEPVTRGDYLFSGGNSLRDYDLLEEAVAGLSVRVRIGTRWVPRRQAAQLDASTVTHTEFLSLMRASQAVVLPLLKSSRSTGQQTYLNAMALGKPVIVTDAPGVRDYIEAGVTGVVVEPTVSALRAAIMDVLDPARSDHYALMGRQARSRVLGRYTEAHYRAELLRLAERC